MSDSVRPHRRQPTRLPCPWDSPGKNTGVGCHFLVQCMKVKSESEVARSCPTLHDPMDCSPPGSSIHGVFQERVLEWGAITFSAFTPYLFSIKTISGRFQGTSNMNSERKEIRCLKKKSSVIKNELNCGMRSTLKSCSPSCQH